MDLKQNQTDEMSENVKTSTEFSYHQTHEVVKGGNILLSCNFSTSGKFLKRATKKIISVFHVFTGFFHKITLFKTRLGLPRRALSK